MLFWGAFVHGPSSRIRTRGIGDLSAGSSSIDEVADCCLRCDRREEPLASSVHRVISSEHRGIVEATGHKQRDVSDVMKCNCEYIL